MLTEMPEKLQIEKELSEALVRVLSEPGAALPDDGWRLQIFTAA
jgi:hypothetical protein